MLLTAAAWTVAWTVPNRGSELYGLTAWQASLAAAGSLAAGAGLWLAGFSRILELRRILEG